MKEYKSICLLVEDIPELGERLNKYALKGWCIKDTITNGIPIEDSFKFVYLLEREKPIEVRINSNNIIKTTSRGSI